MKVIFFWSVVVGCGVTSNVEKKKKMEGDLFKKRWCSRDRGQSESAYSVDDWQQISAAAYDHLTVREFFFVF